MYACIKRRVGASRRSSSATSLSTFSSPHTEPSSAQTVFLLPVPYILIYNVISTNQTEALLAPHHHWPHGSLLVVGLRPLLVRPPGHRPPPRARRFDFRLHQHTYHTSPTGAPWTRRSSPAGLPAPTFLRYFRFRRYSSSGPELRAAPPSGGAHAETRARSFDFVPRRTRTTRTAGRDRAGRTAQSRADPRLRSMRAICARRAGTAAAGRMATSSRSRIRQGMCSRMMLVSRRLRLTDGL